MAFLLFPKRGFDSHPRSSSLEADVVVGLLFLLDEKPMSSIT